jgi:two-component system, cell cycle sensor histidine kinase and response regulator CckA
MNSFASDISDRKHVEEQLFLQQFLIENSDTIFMQYCAEKAGKILMVNEAACRSLGYTRDELLALSDVDITPIYTVEERRDLFRILEACRSLAGVTLLRRKDGSVFPVEYMANKQVLYGKSYFFWFFSDRSERKQAEDALRESEARLKLAMHMAKLVQWEYDVATGMLRCDDQLYTLYGTSMDRKAGT